MFSLIITIISIALVAALALATLYYGGDAFNQGRAGADASRLINEGQQVNAAVALAAATAATWVDTDNANYAGTVKVSGTGSGLAVGPLIGYKLVTSVGFTFEAQGGVQFAAVKADAKASDGASSAQASDSDSSVFPLLNLNIGWTF